MGCKWAECCECPLALRRTKVVHPRGRGTRVMFVGEAPGEDEERLGSAFVGRSGKLLDQWIEVLGLTEKDVYITNVVKCRPPKNRDPTPFEIESCLCWLKDEIEQVDPALVVPLGRFAREVVKGIVPEAQYGLALKHPAWYLRQGGWIPTEELTFIRRKLDGQS